MRLAIEGSGFRSAATEFGEANRVAALHYDSLTAKLDGYAAMAGDDTTSAAFASAYDEAAAEAVASMVDLVDAFANLGRLTETSLANHRDANVASIIAGATVYDGGSVLDPGYVSVLPASPPTALGGDPPSFSDEVRWVLDHVEGFVWPNADVDRLREAAHTWRSAEADLDGLTRFCGTAAGALASQLSPEIPVAVAATEELAVTVRELAAQYAALADACDSYADQVEAAHDEIESLTKQLLAEVVVGVLVGAAVTAITGGAAAGVSTGAVIARVASYSPRFAAVINTLRALALGASSTLRSTSATIRTLGVRIRKFAGGRMLARTEAGQIGFRGSNRFGRGFLRAHEHSGSHTLARHVGKSRDELLERLQREPWIKRSSSFPDDDVAERAIGRLLRENDDVIRAWLAGGKGDLGLEGGGSAVTGVSVSPGGLPETVRRLRVVLRSDADMPDGYRIFTAYPQP